MNLKILLVPLIIFFASCAAKIPPSTQTKPAGCNSQVTPVIISANSESIPDNILNGDCQCSDSNDKLRCNFHLTLLSRNKSDSQNDNFQEKARNKRIESSTDEHLVSLCASLRTMLTTLAERKDFPNEIRNIYLKQITRLSRCNATTIAAVNAEIQKQNRRYCTLVVSGWSEDFKNISPTEWHSDMTPGTDHSTINSLELGVNGSWNYVSKKEIVENGSLPNKINSAPTVFRTSGGYKLDCEFIN